MSSEEHQLVGPDTDAATTTGSTSTAAETAETAVTAAFTETTTTSAVTAAATAVRRPRKRTVFTTDESLERIELEKQYRAEQLAARALRKKENQGRADLQAEAAKAESVASVRAYLLATLARAANERLESLEGEAVVPGDWEDMDDSLRALAVDTAEAVRMLL